LSAFRTSSLVLLLAILSILPTGCAGQAGIGQVEDAVISPDGKYFAQSTAFGTTVQEELLVDELCVSQQDVNGIGVVDDDLAANLEGGPLADLPGLERLDRLL